MRLQRANSVAAAVMVAVALAPGALRAEEVTIVGCAQAGVETGCVVLSSGGALYNITAAKPAPQVGARGRVTGTIGGGVSLCQQGIILSPSTWEGVAGASCPDAAPR
jgi:hypothetical protein